MGNNGIAKGNGDLRVEQIALPLEACQRLHDAPTGDPVGRPRRRRRTQAEDAPVAPGQALMMCPVCGKGPIAEGNLCGWCGKRTRKR